MTPAEFKARTKRLALRIIRLVAALPRRRVSRAIGDQMLRSGTSVGANYRAACRARSRPDFVAKLALVEEEADETAYWLELIVESELVKPSRLRFLMQEAEEIVAMVSASRITARSSKPR